MPGASFRAFIQARAADDAGAEGDTASDAPGAPSAADLRAINKLARRPVRAEDVYVFDCIPSNDQLDAYYTHMGATSLRNYAKDAKAGNVALMNSHRTGGGFFSPRP